MICPKCGKEYAERPAMSRRGDMEICPSCGALEAMEDAGFGEEQKKAILDKLEKQY